MSTEAVLCIFGGSIVLLFMLLFGVGYNLSDIEEKIKMVNRVISSNDKYIYSVEERLYKRIQGLEKENETIKEVLNITADKEAENEPG